MILTRVLPSADVSVDLDGADARAQVAELYRPPRQEWLRINLVGTISGAATGHDGTSESISNPVDRLILNVIRSLAEVVLVGAASVRREGYFVPRRAALAVVTRSGDLSGHRITSGGERGPLLVLCPASASERAARTVGDPDARILPIADHDGYLGSAEIVGALHGAGYASIVAEGGPQLAARLARDRVVDELCLTTSPQLSTPDVALFGPLGASPIPLTLAQLLIDGGGAAYARWSFPA